MGFNGGKSVADNGTRKLAGRYRAEDTPRELVMRPSDILPASLRKPTRVVWSGASDGPRK